MLGTKPSNELIVELFTKHRTRLKRIAQSVLKYKKHLDYSYEDDLIHGFYMYLVRSDYTFPMQDKGALDQLFTSFNFYARRTVIKRLIHDQRYNISDKETELAILNLRSEITPEQYLQAKYIEDIYHNFMFKMAAKTPIRFKAFYKTQELGSIAEAARELNENYETVKTHTRTALLDLKKELSNAI